MKNLQTYEDFLLEKVSTVLTDIVKNKKEFAVKVGSGGHGIENPTEEKVIEMIKEIIDHYFFDWEFYYNNTDHKKEYREWYIKYVKEPLLKDIDKFFKTYIEIKDGVVVKNAWTLKKEFSEESIIKQQFIKDKTIPDAVRWDWNLYRWDYAGEKPDPKRYEYLGEWPNKTIKKK